MTVPTLSAGAHGALSHQDFLDDFIGSLSKVQKDMESRFRAALASSEAAAATRLADSEAAAATQLADAEARWSEALKEEQAHSARLKEELTAVKDRERQLAYKLSCVATELGGFDSIAKDLGVDETQVQKWWDEKQAAEKREAEAKKARTKAAMEAAAKERADKLRSEQEKAARSRQQREKAEKEREEAQLQALVQSFDRFPFDVNCSPRRCHLDSTLYFLVQWCPEIKAHFANRHATVGQILLFAQSKGVDLCRVQWDVRFSDESGYNEDCTRKGISVRETLAMIRDWALQYLKENPGVVRKTAQLDWYAISREQYEAIKTAERKGVSLQDSQLETFYSWMWCAQKYVESARWFVQG